jgi:hypothetical protein
VGTDAVSRVVTEETGREACLGPAPVESDTQAGDAPGFLTDIWPGHDSQESNPFVIVWVSRHSAASWLCCFPALEVDRLARPVEHNTHAGGLPIDWAVAGGEQRPAIHHHARSGPPQGGHRLHERPGGRPPGPVRWDGSNG